MTAANLLNQFKESALDRIHSPDEQSWYQAWPTLIAPGLSPTEVALHAGYYASGAAGLFTAGYQGAVRATFPEVPTTGWAAFAVSEDKTDPATNPALRLHQQEGQWRLHGTKSWIAQSRYVDHLVVTARLDNDEVATVLLDRHHHAMEISHRQQPSFLPAMSQGFLRLDNCLIEDSALLSNDRRKQFVKNESKFVMLAGAAWLWAQLTEENLALTAQLDELLRLLIECCQRPNHTIAELAVCDDQLQCALLALEAAKVVTGIANWQQERRIFSLYSSGIQSRR